MTAVDTNVPFILLECIFTTNLRGGRCLLVLERNSRINGRFIYFLNRIVDLSFFQGTPVSLLHSMLGDWSAVTHLLSHWSVLLIVNFDVFFVDYVFFYAFFFGYDAVLNPLADSVFFGAAVHRCLQTVLRERVEEFVFFFWRAVEAVHRRAQTVFFF